MFVGFPMAWHFNRCLGQSLILWFLVRLKTWGHIDGQRSLLCCTVSVLNSSKQTGGVAFVVGLIFCFSVFVFCFKDVFGATEDWRQRWQIYVQETCSNDVVWRGGENKEPWGRNSMQWLIFISCFTRSWDWKMPGLGWVVQSLIKREFWFQFCNVSVRFSAYCLAFCLKFKYS